MSAVVSGSSCPGGANVGSRHAIYRGGLLPVVALMTCYLTSDNCWQLRRQSHCNRSALSTDTAINVCRYNLMRRRRIFIGHHYALRAPLKPPPVLWEWFGQKPVDFRNFWCTKFWRNLTYFLQNCLAHCFAKSKEAISAINLIIFAFVAASEKSSQSKKLVRLYRWEMATSS